jgi:transposase
MLVRECPMCGEFMRLREHEITDRVPGTPQTKTTKSREWVCPECDYFEDADENEGDVKTSNG